MAGVLFYVQPLMGVGHLKRAAAICRALAAAELEVTLLSGGEVVPGLDTRGVTFVQLPPARAADESFTTLVGADGQRVDERWRQQRSRQVLDLLERLRPRVVLTEHFPFGRRLLYFELLPLLKAAGLIRPRPWLLCSVRDILAGASRRERQEEMLILANACYDAILVHGDAGLIPFQRSFAFVPELAPALVHTGYVIAPSPPPPSLSRKGEVLVSAGSRAMGRTLLHAALAARPLTPLARHPWRILVGLRFPQGELERLQQRAPAGVMLERFRPDFSHLLKGAALSISQGGYNTTLEALRAGVPILLVPYSRAEDAEQWLRADLLHRCGAAVRGETSDPRALAQGAALALAQGPWRGRLRLDGAAITARLVAAWATRLPPQRAGISSLPIPFPPP